MGMGVNIRGINSFPGLEVKTASLYDGGEGHPLNQRWRLRKDTTFRVININEYYALNDTMALRFAIFFRKWKPAPFVNILFGFTGIDRLHGWCSLNMERIIQETIWKKRVSCPARAIHQTDVEHELQIVEFSQSSGLMFPLEGFHIRTISQECGFFK
jgi:hypothetical protein